jgi:hypothetical protein
MSTALNYTRRRLLGLAWTNLTQTQPTRSCTALPLLTHVPATASTTALRCNLSRKLYNYSSPTTTELRRNATSSATKHSIASNTGTIIAKTECDTEQEKLKITWSGGKCSSDQFATAYELVGYVDIAKYCNPYIIPPLLAY